MPVGGRPRLTTWLGISRGRGYSVNLYSGCVPRKHQWHSSSLSSRTTGLRPSVKAPAIIPHNTDVPACLIFAFAFAILSSWAFSSFYKREKTSTPQHKLGNNALLAKRTASFLNHFLTSPLIASHSLSTNLENFTSTSLRTSKTLALALNALPELTVRFTAGGYKTI